MNIVVCSSFFLNAPDEKTYFIAELLSGLAVREQAHHFLLLTDKKKNATSYSFPSNVQLIEAAYPKGNSILRRSLWHNVQFPLFLKKINAGLLLSFDVPCTASLPIPQIVVLPEGEKINARWLKKATLIAVYTQRYQKKWQSRFPGGNPKIHIIPASVSTIYHPLQSEEKEKTKTTYCEGKEFFLCPGKQAAQETLIRLLHAFSLFKKRQQSSMKLLLMVQPGKEFLTRLTNYKYRKDIVFVHSIPPAEEAALIGSSYAAILLPDDPEPVINSLKVLNCSVPLIASEDSPAKEIASDAALYFQSGEEKNWADMMIRVYTNENLKNRLSTRAETITRQFSIQKTTEQLIHCLQKAVH
jgi:hypothetical protein